MKHKKKTIAAVVTAVCFLGLTPSVVRGYSVGGPSMAPTLWLGDRAITLQVAYDMRLPYTDQVLLQTGSPDRGDVVLYQDEVKDIRAFKRIIGLPNDTVALRDNVVHLNGSAIPQAELPRIDFDAVPDEHEMGDRVLTETVDETTYRITYSPGGRGLANFGPIVVPEGQYFILGDHRDNSQDSRYIGCIRRDQIKGLMIYGTRSD